MLPWHGYRAMWGCALIADKHDPDVRSTGVRVSLGAIAENFVTQPTRYLSTIVSALELMLKLTLRRPHTVSSGVSAHASVRFRLLATSALGSLSLQPRESIGRQVVRLETQSLKRAACCCSLTLYLLGSATQVATVVVKMASVLATCTAIQTREKLIKALQKSPKACWTVPRRRGKGNFFMLPPFKEEEEQIQVNSPEHGCALLSHLNGPLKYTP